MDETGVTITKYANTEAAERGEPTEVYHAPVDPKPGVAWSTESTVTKYASEADAAADQPYAVEHFTGNLGLNEGLAEIWQLVSGLGGTVYGATTILEVGSSATAEAATQTGVQTSLGTATVSGAPSTSNQSITWTSSFGAGTATGAWAEWCVKNTGGKDLNRKVQAMGSKGAGEVWSLAVTLTLS
jgi:hypothetical protein